MSASVNWSSQFGGTYGETVHPNAAAGPGVAFLTGTYGTGGGVGLGANATAVYGDILVAFGPGFGSSGSLLLTFPSAAPTLRFSADWASLNPEPSGDTIVLAWTHQGNPMIAGKTYRIHYEGTLT